VESVSKKGHNFVIESLHKIAKLSVEIGSVEAEISKLQKMNDYGGEETIARPDSFETSSPSPPISRRRPLRSMEETPDAVASPNNRR
jgi:hypothetical protein